MNSPKLGAHVSISGGYEKALESITKMGGNCLQMFSASPRGWNIVRVDHKVADLFRKKALSLHIAPVYFHASYLINLADEGRIGHLSKQSLIAELTAAHEMGVEGSIIHLGSYKENKNGTKFGALIGHIREILDKTPHDTKFIIENAGNKKIGQSLSELHEILEAVDDSRIHICLDSCHLYSAGYSLQTEKQLESFIAEFDKTIGLDRLEVWHLNDSRDPFESGRDRHENIGQGTIGLQEFKLIITHPRLKTLPFIIETPGFDGNGPDKKNLDILKGLL